MYATNELADQTLNSHTAYFMSTNMFLKAIDSLKTLNSCNVRTIKYILFVPSLNLRSVKNILPPRQYRICCIQFIICSYNFSFKIMMHCSSSVTHFVKLKLSMFWKSVSIYKS